MTEIRSNLSSSTMSRVVMAGLVSMAALTVAPPPTGLSKELLSGNKYSPKDSGATFDSFRSGITGQYNHTPIPFEQTVGNFYARLISNQEPLGAEFERVLFENLWDLYES